MITQNTHVVRQQVEDTLVAGLRFRGHYADVGERLRHLKAGIGPARCGKAIILYYEHDPVHGHDIEVCYPVDHAVDTDTITSHILPGGEMLSITHRGSYDTIGEAWGTLFHYANEVGIGLSTRPSREVYLENSAEHGDDADRYVTAIMHPVLLPLWMDRLRDGLDKHTDEATRRKVIAGHQALTPETAPAAKAAWARLAMQRLDEAVPDPVLRQRIMAGCAHEFPPARVAQLRAKFLELGEDVDALLAFMYDDSKSFYSRPYREGNQITVTKVPHLREQYESATNSAEKRAAYCHCYLVKEAIRNRDLPSPTYCYCGAGWFDQLWSGITEGPVRVEMLKSILSGADQCTFRIHLPPEIVKD